MLSRNQFHDIMELLESFDLMSRNSAFRKYKPDVPLNSHAKEWYVTVSLQLCVISVPFSLLLLLILVLL